MAKYTGRGGTLSVESAVPATFTDIAQITSIGSVAITSDEVEVTTLDNTSGFREYLQTFKDAGELPVTIVWDPALPTHGESADGLWGLMISGEVKNWQITFPTTPPYTAEFAGFVKSFPTPALTPDDALTADITIRVSGTVTLVAGTLTTLSDQEREWQRRNPGVALPPRAGQMPPMPPPRNPPQVSPRTLGD